MNHFKVIQVLYKKKHQISLFSLQIVNKPMRLDEKIGCSTIN